MIECRFHGERGVQERDVVTDERSPPRPGEELIKTLAVRIEVVRGSSNSNRRPADRISARSSLALPPRAPRRGGSAGPGTTQHRDVARASASGDTRRFRLLCLDRRSEHVSSDACSSAGGAPSPPPPRCRSTSPRAARRILDALVRRRRCRRILRRYPRRRGVYRAGRGSSPPRTLWVLVFLPLRTTIPTLSRGRQKAEALTTFIPPAIHRKTFDLEGVHGQAHLSTWFGMGAVRTAVPRGDANSPGASTRPVCSRRSR